MSFAESRGSLDGRGRRLTVALVSASLLCLAVPAQAASQDAQAQAGWEFVVRPYVLLPHMDGQVALGSIEVDVETGPGEIFEALDFGAMLFLEATNQTWTITLDGLYMDLGADGATPVTAREAQADVKQLAIEATGMRRVAAWAEVGVGGRVNSIEAGLRVAPGGVLPGRDASETKTWFDPLVVTRLTVPGDNAWRLTLDGDVGGFGVGSEFAWQVFPAVGYRFGDLFELSAGYRALGMKYETGSGDDLFVYDMVIFGPQLGFVFHF